MKINDVTLATMMALHDSKSGFLKVRAPGWPPECFFECQQISGLFVNGHFEDGSIESFLKESTNWEHWKNPEDCQPEIKPSPGIATDGDAFP